MKVFAETYCDHGRTEPHGFELTNCPGGTREELTMEAQTYKCSQHGHRATPRCNDNPDCILQLGVFLPVETPDHDDISTGIPAPEITVVDGEVVPVETL